MTVSPLIDAYTAFRREISLIFAAELRDTGLGPQQAVVLYRLLDEPCSMSELAAHTQSDPAATTRTVASLEKVGFVKRMADEKDARKSIIQLTPKGRTRAQGALEVRDRISLMLDETLAPTERKELTRLLGQVTTGLQGSRAEKTKKS